MSELIRFGGESPQVAMQNKQASSLHSVLFPRKNHVCHHHG